MNCFEEDDFTREQYYHDTRWIAELKDGRRVYMDDGRPGAEPNSAWLRLQNYVRQESVPVVGLSVQFRSHVEDPLPKNQNGYFFAKSILGGFGGYNQGFFLIGYLQGDTLKVQRWSTPELILIEEEERDPKEAGEFLLVNPK